MTSNRKIGKYFYDLPEIMYKIGVYGHWKITGNLRKSKSNIMEIECSCIHCNTIKWKSKYDLLEERNCMKCRSMYRKRNYYRNKKSRENPIGKYIEKYRQAAIEKYDKTKDEFEDIRHDKF